MTDDLFEIPPLQASPLAGEKDDFVIPATAEDVLANLQSDQLSDFYYRMQLIRRFEQRAYQVYLQRKIGGFCHLYTGQEAVAVSAFTAIEPGRDYSITAYRDHGYALAAGMDADVVMAELYGKKTGCSKGKGGSMHLFDIDRKFMGGHAIVGGHIPLAAGLGFAAKYRGEKAVVLCFLGDGAMNQGAVHEGMNLAGLYQLPVIFICENNGYGMGTRVKRASAEVRLYRRSDAHGIPGYRADGLDVLAAHAVFERAVARTRDKGEPLFLEMMTYRYRGHSMSDPAEYRSDEELEKYKKRDPIERLKKQLLNKEILTRKQFDEIDEKVESEVQEALQFAEQSDDPDLEALYDDIYSSYPREMTGRN
ncbi:MAG: pyruvate dehydrogenase (acetyl-transferring) E1 component subunit alpha [bacterium]